MNGPQDGFHPLEVWNFTNRFWKEIILKLPFKTPADVYLKLSINATRRAKWFAKLGFTRTQSPLFVTLNSLKPGGYVGAVNVIIERVYPITVSQITYW